MLQYIANTNAGLDVAVEHETDEINAGVAENIGYAEIVVHDLVDGIKGILFVDNGIEQDAKRPDILRRALVGSTSEDFGRGIVYSFVSSDSSYA